MLHDLVQDYDQYDKILKLLSPKGYVFALNVRGITPGIRHVTFPEGWWKEYRDNRYMLHDPVVYWGQFNVGHKRWSEIKTLKVVLRGSVVFERAKKYGMHYGVCFSRKSTAGPKLKSFFTLAREDREFEDKEIEQLNCIFDVVASAAENIKLLTDGEIEALNYAAQGLSYLETSKKTNVSPDTIKLRLTTARKALRSKTTIEAVLNAYSRGLIKLHGEYAKW